MEILRIHASYVDVDQNDAIRRRELENMGKDRLPRMVVCRNAREVALVVNRGLQYAHRDSNNMASYLGPIWNLSGDQVIHIGRCYGISLREHYGFTIPNIIMDFPFPMAAYRRNFWQKALLFIENIQEFRLFFSVNQNFPRRFGARWPYLSSRGTVLFSYPHSLAKDNPKRRSAYFGKLDRLCAKRGVVDYGVWFPFALPYEAHNEITDQYGVSTVMTGRAL